MERVVEKSGRSPNDFWNLHKCHKRAPEYNIKLLFKFYEVVNHGIKLNFLPVLGKFETVMVIIVSYAEFDHFTEQLHDKQ